jgi:hypothetical protein
MYKFDSAEPSIKELIQNVSADCFKQIINNNTVRINNMMYNKGVPTFYYTNVFQPLNGSVIYPISHNYYYLIDYLIKNCIIDTNIVLKSNGVSQIQVILYDSCMYTSIDYDAIIYDLSYTLKHKISYRKICLLMVSILCLYKLIR